MPCSLNRRDALLAVPASLLILAACRSQPTSTELLRSAGKEARARLEELAQGPEEADRLLALLSEIEQIAIEYVERHGESCLEADRMMKDRSITSAAIADRIAASSQERLRLDERLLDRQEQLKRSLGPQRWARLVGYLNDPERIERVRGRGA